VTQEPQHEGWNLLVRAVLGLSPQPTKLIAAIAQANACVRVTRNVGDFDFLPGLEVANPWG
jgi:predicted nucleic acid-binding protein